MAIPEHVFKAYDIRGIVGDELTPEFVQQIGHAFGLLLGGKDGPKRVAIGRDMRQSSEEFSAAMRRGLEAAGCSTVDIGMVTTPMLNYYVGGHEDVDGGVMVTASHNPSEWNGFKMCYGDVKPVGGKSGLQEMKDRIVNGDLPTVERDVTADTIVGWPMQYIEMIAPEPGAYKGLKIAVDTGNGMVGAFIEAFAQRLGIELLPLFTELDDTFPNHEANPLKVETLAELQKLVVAEGAHAGIAFDADGDRIGAVDENGRVIEGDRLGLLIAQSLLQDHPGGRVLIDVRCSRDVENGIKSAGGATSLSPVGHAKIKEQMRAEDAVLAMELSAHFYFADKYYVESALRSMVMLLDVMKQSEASLSELVNADRHTVASGEINFHVEDKRAMMDEVRVWCEGQGMPILTIDGIRADADDWWVSLRASNTEPVLRLNVEADTEDAMTKNRDAIMEMIASSANGGPRETSH